MAINRVIVNEETLLDLTDDTVTPSAMMNGYTAHDKTGAAIVGTMTTATIYTGASKPSDSIGENGDVFLIIGE